MQILPKDLYPVIFTRKSVRSYSNEPLSGEQLSDIESFFTRTIPLLPDEPLEMLVRPDRGAPYRALAFCANTPAGNANLGFRLQQLDLYLHSKGIGSLWYGTGRKPKDVPEMNPFSYAICMRFGMPSGSIDRDLASFKRNPIEAVTNNPELYPVLEAARLAPSATNSQLWYYFCADNVIHAYKKDIGFLRDKMYGRMNQIDMGIGLCHLVLSLQQAGYGIEIDQLADPPSLEKHSYTISVRFAK